MFEPRWGLFFVIFFLLCSPALSALSHRRLGALGRRPRAPNRRRSSAARARAMRARERGSDVREGRSSARNKYRRMNGLTTLWIEYLRKTTRRMLWRLHTDETWDTARSRIRGRTRALVIGRHLRLVAESRVGATLALTATMRRAAARSLRSSAAARRQPTPSRLLHVQSGPQVADPPVQITTLPNGIRVATENTPGHFSSVGLYVDAGSRYETPSMLGVSHFIDRMAFKVCSLLNYTYHPFSSFGQTTKSRSEEDMALDMDALGGQILCSSARESIMYQSSHFNKGTPLALSLIADTVLHPALLPEEIEGQREAARYELREVSSKPEMILPEILHHVAYDGKGLGSPLLCPEERIDLVDADMMRKYMKEWYRPDRMVIAGAGMEHKQLVDLAHERFHMIPAVDASQPRLDSRSSASAPQVSPNLLQTSQPSSPSLYKSLTRAASSYLYYPESPSDASPPSQSTYVGGHRFIRDTLTDFNHLYLSFEGVGIHDDDVYAVATMQVLLGGGGSFSAGASSLCSFPPPLLTLLPLFQAAPARACTRVCTPTSSTTSRRLTTARPSTTSTPTRPSSAFSLLSSPEKAAKGTLPRTSSPTSPTSSRSSSIPPFLPPSSSAPRTNSSRAS